MLQTLILTLFAYNYPNFGIITLNIDTIALVNLFHLRFLNNTMNCVIFGFFLQIPFRSVSSIPSHFRMKKYGPQKNVMNSV